MPKVVKNYRLAAKVDSLRSFSLNSKEKIKSAKDFAQIIELGTKITSDDKRLKAVFYLRDNEDSATKVLLGVAVSKRFGKAYKRNRLKRLIRESYRLNKDILSVINLENSKSLYIVIMPYKIYYLINKKPRLKDFFISMESILLKIKKGVL